jgi:uncharacterized protein with PQ loop repeat
VTAAEAVGLAAASVSAGFGIPQLWRLVRGSTAAGVSAASWWMTCCAGLLWLPHNWARGEWSAIAANGLSALCAAAVLGRRATLARGDQAALAVPLAVAGAVGVSVTTGLVALGWIAAALGLVRFLPQALALLRRADPAGVSVWTWLLAATSGGLWFTYGALHGDVVVALPALITLPLTLFILARLTLLRLTISASATSAKIWSIKD